MARGRRELGEPSTPRRSQRGKAPSLAKEFWSPTRDTSGNVVDYEDLYERLLKKTQVPGRWLEFNKFDFRDFQSKLINMGWDEFLSMTLKNEWFPRIVSQFYANIKPIDDESFVSLIKGESIIVSKQLLVDLFLIPSDGLNILGLSADEVENPSRFDLVFENQVSYFSKDLKEEARMIHKVVCANMITKKGNFDRITEDALVLVYCFMREIKVDLVSLIFDRMVNGASFSSLPYGLMISRICQHYKIDLSLETSKSIGPPFNARSLKLMKIQPEIRIVEEEEEAGPSQVVGSPDILERMSSIEKSQKRLVKCHKKLKKKQNFLVKTVKGIGKMVKKILENQEEIMKNLGCGPSSPQHFSPIHLSPQHVSATPSTSSTPSATF